MGRRWMPLIPSIDAEPHLDKSFCFQKLRPLMSSIPTEFRGVTAVAKANVYFDGKVVSHSILFPDGTRKTLGLIYPGKYHFGTNQAERMEIVAGTCSVKLDGQDSTSGYSASQAFEVPAKSGFDIEVPSGICEYICSFLP